MIELVIAVSFIILLMTVICYCCGDNQTIGNDGWPRYTTHKERFVSGAKWFFIAVLVLGGGSASILFLIWAFFWSLKTITDFVFGVG